MAFQPFNVLKNLLNPLTSKAQSAVNSITSAASNVINTAGVVDFAASNISYLNSSNEKTGLFLQYPIEQRDQEHYILIDIIERLPQDDGTGGELVNRGSTLRGNNLSDIVLNTKKIPESFTTSEISTQPQKIAAPIRSPSESISTSALEKPIDIVGDSDFNLIISIAQSNNPAVEIAIMLEKIRTKLENENPLNPILFELSMESRRLRSLGNMPLDANNLQILTNKLQKWIG